jgi:hypothetical protein
MKKGSAVMAFEFKAITEDGTAIVLQFKRYGDAPGRISRRNIGDMERQVWEYLEWGLESPANWPEQSLLPGYNVFDVVKQRDITKIYQQWQADDDEEDEKKPEKSEKPDPPKDLGS